MCLTFYQETLSILNRAQMVSNMHLKIKSARALFGRVAMTGKQLSTTHSADCLFLSRQSSQQASSSAEGCGLLEVEYYLRLISQLVSQAAEFE